MDSSYELFQQRTLCRCLAVQDKEQPALSIRTFAVTCELQLSGLQDRPPNDTYSRARLQRHLVNLPGDLSESPQTTTTRFAAPMKTERSRDKAAAYSYLGPALTAPSRCSGIYFLKKSCRDIFGVGHGLGIDSRREGSEPRDAPRFRVRDWLELRQRCFPLVQAQPTRRQHGVMEYEVRSTVIFFSLPPAPKRLFAIVVDRTRCGRAKPRS